MTQYTLSPTPVKSIPVDGLNTKFIIAARIDTTLLDSASGNSYVFAGVPANCVIERTSIVQRTQGTTTACLHIGTDGDSGVNDLLGATPQALTGAAGALITSATRVQIYAADFLAVGFAKAEATAIFDIYVEITSLQPAVAVLSQ